MGRGVTLINFFGLGATGLAQLATGRLHGAVSTTPPEAPYAALFGFFAVMILAGCAVYAFAQDRTD
jgi:hypothetical protein